MKKKVLIISLCALIMMFVISTSPNGFVVHSNSCCTNPTLCPQEEMCDTFNPDLEQPNTPNGNNARYAIGALLLLTCIGLIHKTVAPKEKV